MNKFYVYCIFMLFILMSTMFFIKVEGAQQQSGLEEISVAVYNGDDTFDWEYYTDFESVNSSLSFPYEWEVGNKKYRIIAEDFSIKNIIKDFTNDYNVLIYDGADTKLKWVGFPVGEAFMEHIKLPNKEKYPGYSRIVRNLDNFLSAGNGYIGHCGGTTFALEMDEDQEPRTLTEFKSHTSSFL